jgi:hypothetical protein
MHTRAGRESEHVESAPAQSIVTACSPRKPDWKPVSGEQAVRRALVG